MGTLFACLVLAISAVAAVDFTEFVDTKIGGSYRGHTFPGATCPFSLVQASPDTGLCDWDHCSGYVWEDPCIYGFSQTHLSGTGCPDLADVRLLPFTDDFDSPDPRTWRLAKDFRTESGRPGFYTVALTNAGVVAELTATPRVGVHRYTYAPGKPVKLLVDLQWANVGNMSGAVVAFSNRLDAAHAAIVGGRRTHAWLRRSVSWKVVFDRPWKDARLLPKADPKELAERWVLEFEPGAPLVVKAAISTVDEDGAAKNYAAEAEGKTFDDIRAEARAKWQALLGRFEVPGASAEQRTAFYTALYHLFIQPNNIADVDGRYRGGDAKVATAKDGVYYTGLSLWDTFRAAHPFYTIAVPERVDGFVNSMLGHYRALGFLPVIPYFGWESHCMIGNHSVPVIVDAYKKGFRGFDVDLAFEAVTNSLTVLHTDPFGRRKIKENWDLYDRYGYYPFDEIKGESVSRTLECSFDDWCAAEFCHALGRGDEAFFRKRANYWKNLFDPETRLMRGRTGSGSWRTPFDPFSTGHDHNKANDYTEGNAWQYTWHVLHDPQGLVAAMGGPEPFVQRLDSVFRQPEDLHDQPPDVTGLIGQYVHGNEPSHHVAYFYSLAGAPRRTAEVVREVCDRFYGVKPGDLCGNDDCGQMSAWYVFAAMGFYPFNPASGEYVIGAPQVPEVRIRLGNGEREFRVVAKNLSRENKYVKSVTLNGKPVTDWKIRHADIMAGGELVFEMTAVADCAEYVDPFIGTSATGHTFPAACVPFGLVQAGPDTAGRETMWWHYCSGYRHEDDRIAGFSQTHLNGTGGIDLGDVRILPMSLCTNDNCHNCSQISNANSTCSRLNNSVKKLSEVAEPGYYAATLDGGIKVEVAAAEHAAIYRIKFEKGSAGLLVDLLHGLSLRQNDNANKVRSSVAFDGKTGLSGTITRSGWVTRDVSFSIAFDRPFASVETLPPRKDGETAPRYVFDFDLKDGETLMVKIALSAEGGAEAAKRNLAAEIPGWNFDAVKDAAHVKWNEVLSRATVEGTDEQKKNWYTALYHLFIQPNNIADVGEKPFYSTLSLWDTFRAAHPLYTILAPEKAAEFVDSMLEQGRRTGYLPIWTLWGKDNQCMIGTHSVPVIVDWFLKEGNGERGTGNGLDFSHKEHKEHKDSASSASHPSSDRLRGSLCSGDTREVKTNPVNPVNPVQKQKEYWLAAYAQIKDSLTNPHKGRVKERWDLYDKYGYYPFDIIKGESVSRTMECAYDDWCAGVMAEKLGFAVDAEFFFKRAQSWKNVFDPSLGLVRGKDSKGNWREPFDPYTLGGAGRDNDFTEGNAFQYSWHVMQDVPGLIAAMGGHEAFVKKLDSIFSAPSKTEGMGEVLDVTGLIGQYVHGNEPSHHVIYFYPQVGHPEKAAERIREVFDKFYLPKPDGLCGNDDCGQMSAWYLFSAMGFYPFNPCGGEYVIGAPQVPKVTIKLVGASLRDARGRVGDATLPGECKTLTIIARNLSRENKYVKSVTLNGKPVTDWKICHADIMAGGELVFEMGNCP